MDKGFVERRIGVTHLPETFVSDLTKHIAEENALFKSLRLAAAIFSTLIVVLTWVFIEKNDDIKAMQSTLNQHSVAIAETLAVVKALIEDDRRQQTTIDRNSEKLNRIKP